VNDTNERDLALLAGVKIVSFTQFLLGPAGVQYLADMGADVIKIELPGGNMERRWSGAQTFLGGKSAFHMLAHRNMRAMTLNLKEPAALEIAHKLIRTCDVFVQNFRPAVMDRFGLDYESVRAINERIVYACASGYGSETASRDLPGQDLLLQAVTGLAAITGRAHQAPVPTGSAVVDQHAASLLALGIAGALFQRERTGKGQRIEVTMVQAGLDLQLEPVVYWLNGSAIKPPQGRLGSTFHQAPYGVYETGDGHLVLSMSPIEQLSRALGDPESLADYLDPTVAYSKREEISAVLDGFFRGKRTVQWIEILRQHGVWCAPVNDYAAAFADPVVTEVDPIIEFDDPLAGTVKLLKHPIRYSSGTARIRRPPPGISEHTDEILRELGYDKQWIEGLRRAGAI
jgi:crotonobetainyl-CoA:carnitine CoA-transferase CaiB-like acyl-CoA transferase